MRGKDNRARRKGFQRVKESAKSSETAPVVGGARRRDKPTDARERSDCSPKGRNGDLESPRSTLLS